MCISFGWSLDITKHGVYVALPAYPTGLPEGEGSTLLWDVEQVQHGYTAVMHHEITTLRGTHAENY